MNTILIIILTVGITLILTEWIFKDKLQHFKEQSKIVEKKVNRKKYRKQLIAKMPTKEDLK